MDPESQRKAEWNFVSKTDLIQMLVDKHSGLIKQHTTELEDHRKTAERLERDVERFLKERNKVNEKVAELKTFRDEIHANVRRARVQFFTQIQAASELQQVPENIGLLKKHIGDMEWKLQTEAIKLDEEKTYMDEIRKTVNRLRDATKVQQEKLGIKEEIEARVEEIGKNLANAREVHEKMMELAILAQDRHQRYIEGNIPLQESQRKVPWLKHRIDLHKQSLEYYTGELDRLRSAPEKVEPKTGDKPKKGKGSKEGKGRGKGKKPAPPPKEKAAAAPKEKASNTPKEKAAATPKEKASTTPKEKAAAPPKEDSAPPPKEKAPSKDTKEGPAPAPADTKEGGAK